MGNSHPNMNVFMVPDSGVLCDWEIERLIESGAIGISNYDPSLINPASLDVRLAGPFSILKAIWTDGCLNPLDKTSFRFDEVQTFKDDDGKRSVIIEPLQAMLATLLEEIRLPDNIAAKLFGKSSLARLGLDNSSVGAWIDPGFQGPITIELFNQSAWDIELTEGMKIGQLVFYKTERCSKPYGSEGVGRYQNQERGKGSLGV